VPASSTYDAALPAAPHASDTTRLLTENDSVPGAVGTALRALSDAEVVRRVLGGEAALFEVLMRRHNQRVFRAIRSVLRDDAESEDAAQQAWLQAWAHLAQFQGAAAFSTWLTRIALHEALARAGRGARTSPIDELSEEDDAMRSPTPDPEDRAAERELGRLLEEEVDQLGPLYRTVFVLREVEGMSTAETAEALALSEEAVKVRLHRARLALRDRLSARAGTAARSAFGFQGWRCDRMVAAVMGRILGPGPSA
jgi:RNA polymerase sigma-70 factor (ECF subfamily)